MTYKRIKGVNVSVAEGYEDIAVVDFQPAYDWKGLRKLVRDIEADGIKAIVCEVSHLPDNSRHILVAQIEGVTSGATKLKQTYVGINPDEFNEQSYRILIEPKIADDIDAAVQKLKEELATKEGN